MFVLKGRYKMGESSQVMFSPRPWEIYCFKMIAEHFAFDSVRGQIFLQLTIYKAAHQRSEMTN